MEWIRACKGKWLCATSYITNQCGYSTVLHSLITYNLRDRLHTTFRPRSASCARNITDFIMCPIRSNRNPSTCMHTSTSYRVHSVNECKFPVKARTRSMSFRVVSSTTSCIRSHQNCGHLLVVTLGRGLRVQVHMRCPPTRSASSFITKCPDSLITLSMVDHFTISCVPITNQLKWGTSGVY